jgi:hypothetical protein
MAIDEARARKLLRDFNFPGLFVEELGWDKHKATLSIPIDNRAFELSAVAEKRGMAAFICECDGALPDYNLRRKIERQVAKSAHEHFIIFTDAAKTRQIWQWIKRKPGKPAAAREHHFDRSQTGEALIQKLKSVVFELAEEENLTLVDVTIRARAGFDVEKVTKRFYDRFQKEHGAFLKFIKGIPDDQLQRWYASVMLNRLMFIYFIQKKGFLSGDIDYLRNKLTASEPKDRYYAGFLCPLFFEGFAKKAEERSEAVNQLLGPVPYLNGGLFLRHQIEELHGKSIQIPDTAFEAIFDFFEAYQWHLDERPLRADNEINPDVLGYIFEKYINQKQMGAYYTKEDITEYISKNTVLPFLFDAARPKCKIAFENPNGPTIWDLLNADPDRYIYDAVKKGVDIRLPKEIEAGIKDVSRRGGWNKPAPAEFALPTEIWREVIARRQRCEEIRKKLGAGEVHDVNELITLNIDIRQFAQDVIENCEGPELLRAFWHVIEEVTILDPACGSGAFLFAALNILEPLYEACLDRMGAFVEELDRSPQKHRPEKFSDFRKALECVENHPNRRYFIFKSIILNSLFGVDIMEEAVEICKLRLFLKLAAQIEPDSLKDNLGIEPLPDIDFNIRAGNTLVGYATRDELEAVGKSDLILKQQVGEVLEAAEDAAKLYECFLETQVEGDQSPAEFKRKLTDKFQDARTKCDLFLAETYAFGLSKKPQELRAWQRSHQPFHWFVEFYGVLSKGGFDVIIGNPPWVEFPKVQDQYTLKGFLTLECNNLWAFMVERSYTLLANGARLGLIVPMSVVCTERMLSVQRLIQVAGFSWLASLESDSNPGQLFQGVKQNVTIILGKRGRDAMLWTTRMLRFFQDYRNFVFANVQFAQWSHRNPLHFGIPKVSTIAELRILKKMFSQPPLASQMTATRAKPVLVHRIAHYYIKCFDFVPYFRSDRDGLKKSEDYKEYFFSPPVEQFVGAINSTAFYFYWQIFFDAFKAGKLCVESFPLGNLNDSPMQGELIALAKKLMRDVKSKGTRFRANYAATGKVEYDQFYPRHSKLIMDEIDQVLAQHYGFTDDELDFIINYDIKYRMGVESEQPED